MLTVNDSIYISKVIFLSKIEDCNDFGICDDCTFNVIGHEGSSIIIAKDISIHTPENHYAYRDVPPYEIGPTGLGCPEIGMYIDQDGQIPHTDDTNIGYNYQGLADLGHGYNKLAC